MPPVQSNVHAELEAQIKDIVQDLFRIMVVSSHYDTSGRSSKDVLSDSFKTLSTSLQTVYKTATDPSLTLPHVPPELVQYVEGGRNPDIYTREFVELVRRGNQLVRGKMGAFESFRDVLAGEMSAAMPELKADVDRVLEATGRAGPSEGGAEVGTADAAAGDGTGTGTGTG